VRTRIDQFGVSEPVVQKAGKDRIIVELPGIDDPQRAQDVVQKSAFLEFQITDKTQALEKAFPRLDAGSNKLVRPRQFAGRSLACKNGFGNGCKCRASVAAEQGHNEKSRQRKVRQRED
jgi:preprotein translocase subunit SecD